MLVYNTQQKDLALPEYGRNIQNMVDHCMTIQDRAQRTACAHQIVKTMSILFPASKNEEDANRKFWDHLAIMSDFKLDIDWPFEVIQSDERDTRPEPVPYDTGIISLRQYGRNIESMLDLAASMDDSPERQALINTIANQMKKNLLADSPDDDPEEKIALDIYQLTKGRINLQPGDVLYANYNVVAPATGKKKKKK